MTILVFSRHDRSRYGEIARKLMAEESVCAEQVGFVERPDDPAAVARLNMMGGEFCVNATRSLASTLVWAKKKPPGSREKIILEASGAEGLLECDVTVEENSFVSRIKLPPPEIIAAARPKVTGGREIPLVRLGGICHYIVDEDRFTEPRELFLNELLKEGYAESIINCSDIEAVGIMFLSPEKSFMTPLVYVKGSDSKVWESSCGSGTAAVGAFYCQSQQKDINLTLNQPGGAISVSAAYSDDGITGLWLESQVKISAVGRAYI